MDLRAPLQLQSMIKSMSDVVLPAIDPANGMAQEQAQLILGMMHLMASRLPMQFSYDIDQLTRYVSLARELVGISEGGQRTNEELAMLNSATESSEKTLRGAQTSPDDLEAAVLALRTRISALVEALWSDGEPTCREPIAKAVLAASKEQILRERAWFSPQGWDADMSGYASIESLIGYQHVSTESDS